MDDSLLLAFGLFGTGITLLLLAATIGLFIWRARRQTARYKSLASTF